MKLRKLSSLRHASHVNVLVSEQRLRERDDDVRRGVATVGRQSGR